MEVWFVQGYVYNVLLAEKEPLNLLILELATCPRCTELAQTVVLVNDRLNFRCE
jgi:hypothetical protein